VRVNVVNRAGGSGIQGITYVINADKDGYTLLHTPGTPITIMPAISSEVTYNPLKDLIPLGHFASVPSLFAVRSDSPFKTLADLIDYARKNPNKLNNASAGIGNESYFNLSILSSKIGIKINTIPFKGGGDALPALLGGHVDMATLSLTTLGPHIKAGKVRALAIACKDRTPDFPQIPTTTELGYPYVNIVIWSGVFAPTGTPRSVTEVLVQALEKVFKNTEVMQRAIKAGFTVEYRNPEEFRNFVEAQIRVVEEVVKSANLTKK
jgi:tripartite-type tricarboxylate transporter receptor subunit TctC